jgi:putative peptidoglycan lipid II flippase
VLLLAVYGGSRTIGLGREIGVAYFFGTSAAADRLGAAFTAASIAGILVGEATYASVVRELGRRGSDPASLREGLGELLPVIAWLAAGSAALFAVVAPFVVHFVVLDAGAPLGEVAWLCGLFALAVGSSVVSAAYNAVLTIEGRIAVQNAVQMLFSIGALTAIGLIAAGAIGADARVVAGGWAAGNVAALVVLTRIVPVPRGGRSRAGTHILRAGLPIATSYALLAGQSLIGQAVAGRLGTGRIAALNYADRLFLIPVGFVLTALGPMVLGALTAAGEGGRPRDRVVSAHLRRVVAWVVPAALLFCAVAPWLVSLVFDHGAFGAASLATTRDALDGFALSIAAVALHLVCLRALQAAGRPRDVLTAAAVSAGIFAPAAVGLAATTDLFGVTSAFAVASLASIWVQMGLLGRSLGRGFRASALRDVIAPVTAATVVAATAIVCEHEGVISQGTRAAVLGALAACALAMGRGRWRLEA